MYVTTSIGVSIYPDDGEDAEALIRSADVAMYRAKEQGRDQFQLYAPAMNALAVERMGLEHGLRKAMALDQLVVHYQPIVEVATGRIHGTEALLRCATRSWAWCPPTTSSSWRRLRAHHADGTWILKEACNRTRAGSGGPGSTSRWR